MLSSSRTTRRLGTGLLVAASAGQRLLAYRGIIVLALAHVIALVFLWPSTHEDPSLRGFVLLSYHDSGRALTGAVPYRDFLLEYPLGTLYLMCIPRLLAAGPLGYRGLFFVEVAALDLLTLIALWWVARAADVPTRRPLLLYTLLLFSLGPMVSYRLDLAPAALTLLAVGAHLRGRDRLAALLLAAGTAVKAYPLLLLPLLCIEAWRRGERREARRLVWLCLVGSLVLMSPALLAGVSNVMHDVQFQTGRHLQVESLWATLPLLLHLLARLPLEVAGRDRALVILGPADHLGLLTTPSLLILIATLYWRIARRRSPGLLAPHAILVISTTIVAVAALGEKVLSPQYLLWLIPPMALAAAEGQSMRLAFVLLLVAALMTGWIYPLHYGELIRWLTPAAVVALAVRNLLLGTVIFSLFYASWRRIGPSKAAHP